MSKGEVFLPFTFPHKKTMEEIELTIKQRLDIVKMEERQKEALKELDGILEKIDRQNEKLQKIKEYEEKCLVEIEQAADERVKMAILKLTKAGQAMKELEEKSGQVVLEIKNSAKRAQDGILGLLSRAKELIEKSDILQLNSERVMAEITNARMDLEEKIKTNSEFEKILKQREKEVEVKNKKADEKLKEAKDLAYWHKTPEAEYKQR